MEFTMKSLNLQKAFIKQEKDCLWMIEQILLTPPFSIFHFILVFVFTVIISHQLSIQSWKLEVSVKSLRAQLDNIEQFFFIIITLF